MKKKLLIAVLTLISVCNVKAVENDVFKIDIPDNFVEDKVEEKTNIYKWENKDNNIFHNIVITIDKNDAENKYNVKHFNNEDIANYTKYIEESTNNELKEYDIKVKVSNMKKEVIRSVSNDIEKANDYAARQVNKVEELYEEPEEVEEPEENEIDDEDIPAFLRKIKKNRF